MDEIDQHLIALLRDNARTPVVTLAQQLGLGRAAVQARLKRLEASGVIQGYTLRLRPQSEGRRVRAIMSIAVEGDHGAEVRRSLWGHPAVVGLHQTNGRWDLVAELRADTLERFNTVLGEIRRIKGVANSETSILLASDKA